MGGLTLPPVDTSALLISAAINNLSLKVLKRFPKENLPTLSFNTTTMSGAIAHYAISSSGVVNASDFGIYGALPANLGRRAKIFPQYNVVTGAAGTADTGGAPPLFCNFYTTAKTFDVIQYGCGDQVDIWVDDDYIGHAEPAVAAGVAQAGSSNTITLGAGSSGTNGYYNQFYVRITSGAGAGQLLQIVAYNGSTKTATVAVNWVTIPDATSNYSVENSGIGFALDSATGSIKYINVATSSAAVRKVTVSQANFMGVNIGPNDAIWAAPPLGQITIMVVGDSFWAGTAGPRDNPPFFTQMARLLGLQPVNLSSGGTGFVNTNPVSNRLNFQQRISPPPEAWRNANSATGGTYTLSLTYGGSSQTTPNLAYNSGAATIEAALNALTNVPSNSIDVARGDFNTGAIVLANNMPGAVLTVDNSGLTGGSVTISSWAGDVSSNLPVDSGGNPLPFVLIVPGSGNDSTFSDPQVQASAATIGQAIVNKYPTAIPLFFGVVATVDGTPVGTISSTDISRNAAIKSGAVFLPQLRGKTAFVDTYLAGLGNPTWVNGAGTVAAPTTGTRDFLKSASVVGHPTGLGQGYLAAICAREVLTLFRGA